MKQKTVRMNDFDDRSYWVGDFFAKEKHTLLARIPDSYLNDPFNFIGLNKKIKNFERAYNTIIDNMESSDFMEESCLYYLTHQRYIYTGTGLEDILSKVLLKEYGTCSRVGCSTELIPIGESNDIGKSTTKMYCYNCVCIYLPKGPIKGLDGAAWGKYFPHFLLLTYPYKFKKRKLPEYTPRIYGFKIYECEDDNESLDEDSIYSE